MLVTRLIAPLVAVAVVVVASLDARASENHPTVDRVDQRFSSGDVDEVPSFQRHVVPLFGRLGCNGRACHGSFQGQGGFRLSLFGYDFAADHEALLDQEGPRVDVGSPLESLILNKPTDEDNHEGGLRYEEGSWQYHVFRKWIEAGAEYDAAGIEKLAKLEISPGEIQFKREGDNVQLKVVAVWADGSREDVTPLCRYQTNDDQIAKITDEGYVSAGQPGDTHLVISYDNGVVPIPVIRPVSEYYGEAYPEVETPTRIDGLVVEKLRKLGVIPSELSSDTDFLRRLSLDLTGSLPTPAEVESFLKDRSTDKRARKIDELLESPAYAAWWATKLCDFTGNNDVQLQNVLPIRRGAQASESWYQWIYQRVANNTPYDQLVAGIVTASSRKPGQSYVEYCQDMTNLFKDGTAEKFADLDRMPLFWTRRDFNMQEAPEARAIGFAYAFMGIRIQCAQCHKHPFDQWSKKDFEEFKQFFTTVQFQRNPRDPEDRKEFDKMVEALGVKGKRGNEQRTAFESAMKEGKPVPFSEVMVTKPRAAPARRNRNNQPPPAATARLLGGDTVDMKAHDDVRQPLMDWLRQKDNPYFAKAFVNRVWANYFNVGIVEPPDDLSLANPPSNKPLLEYLANGFIENGYDMKWLHREIANSGTYQRSWKPNESNRLDQTNFSHAIPRRLPAEVAYDALQQATASDERLDELHREIEGRAIAIAGANGQNRNARGATYALTVFGRSIRESNCDCDRSNEPSLLQTVFTQNDQEMLGMIDRRDGWISQVARSLGQTPRSSRAPAVPAGLRQRMANLQKQIQKARAEGNRQRTQALQKQLTALRRRVNPEPQNKQPEKVAAKVDTQQLIRDAYLRTLSRHPDENELAIAQKYVAESPNETDGMRGVVWALVNTKEFIVNH